MTSVETDVGPASPGRGTRPQLQVLGAVGATSSPQWAIDGPA